VVLKEVLLKPEVSGMLRLLPWKDFTGCNIAEKLNLQSEVITRPQILRFKIRKNCIWPHVQHSLSPPPPIEKFECKTCHGSLFIIITWDLKDIENRRNIVLYFTKKNPEETKYFSAMYCHTKLQDTTLSCVKVAYT
jgi:hypothetical protein